MSHLSEFDILEKALEENIDIKIHETNPWPEDNDCEHNNTIKEKNNTIICIDCGEEIYSENLFEKEWKIYSNNDNRHSADPNRCQIRKFNDRSIYKDLQGKNIPDKIITKANELYEKVTQGGIKRKINRTAIVFACVHEAYKLDNNPQNFEKMCKVFNLEKKDASKGINIVTFNIPKNFFEDSNYRNITAFEQAKQIMEKFGAKSHQIDNVKQIYELVKNKSKILSGARVSSFSSGLVYYWIIKNKRNDITIEYFCQLVKLSALTIKKIYNEINKIVNKS